MPIFDRPPTPAEVFNFVSPEPDSTGSWVCAGMRNNERGTYSQTITWDGHSLLAAIENTSKSGGPLKLYIQGQAGQGVLATLNGKDIPIKDALILFCEESENMPPPEKLPKKRSLRVTR